MNWKKEKASDFQSSYKLAEKLSERLDEVGKDLGSMIEEVNNASATLSKTNKADEPVSFPISSLLPYPKYISSRRQMLIMINLHPQRSPKSSASSTHTSLNSRASTSAPPNCKPKSVPPKREPNPLDPGSVVMVVAFIMAIKRATATEMGMEWAEVRLMTFIAPTWVDGEYGASFQGR
jgi:hypothetical protein